MKIFFYSYRLLLFCLILSVLALCFNFLFVMFFFHISCWVDVGVFFLREERSYLMCGCEAFAHFGLGVSPVVTV